MDDINFDELDKAVNSALKTNDLSVEPVVAQTTPTLSPADSFGEPAAAAPAKPLVASVVPPKRRGQFMDMVHPSSDMRTTTQAGSGASVTSPARRPQQDIKPLDPNLMQASAQPELSAEQVEPEQGPNQAVAAIISAAKVEPEQHQDPAAFDDTEVAAQKNEWPDPLDVVPPHQDAVEAKEPSSDDGVYTPDQNAAVAAAEGDFSTGEGVSTPAAEELSEESTRLEGDDETEKPHSSPFIEGAEVEKRPLGGFPGAFKLDESQTTEQQVSVPVELPQELGAEVVSVESDDPEVTAFVEDEKSGESTEVSAEVSASPSAYSGAAQSIPQQYTADTTATNEDNDHSVFDTKEYHQPLTPPVKQHKGLGALKYILIAALLLALGAVGGYAVYLLN